MASRGCPPYGVLRASWRRALLLWSLVVLSEGAAACGKKPVATLSSATRKLSTFCSAGGAGRAMQSLGASPATCSGRADWTLSARVTLPGWALLPAPSLRREREGKEAPSGQVSAAPRESRLQEVFFRQRGGEQGRQGFIHDRPSPC